MLYSARPVSTGLRHFSQVSSHTWFQPPEALYRANNTIHMSLVTSASNRMVEAKVLRAFHPFTNSACILIQPLQYAPGLPDRLICKLADRRIGERTVPWSVDVERQFQTSLPMYIERTGGPPEIDQHGVAPEDPRWFHDLDQWRYVDTALHKEQKAYEALTDAQTLGLVPKFFGRVRIAMSSGRSIHPALDAIDGLLMEYIPGRLMSSISPGADISIGEAEAISQKILDLARRLRRYGVSHNDLHSNNVILRHGTNDPVIIDWGRAGFHALAGKTFAARWMHSSMRQDFYSDIRKILKRSDGNIWHRFNTPPSDTAQRRLVKEWGWGFINSWIRALPKEQLEMLYYEDSTVDPERGLRWRVRPGVKTASIVEDDPVPSY
ncbi:hypothetical protein CPB85DRAFT_932948 [Mucidula mucida]|nr:hypothetical protein CPB85DRAFT_932937 [Mucidula mucida]KAF8904981.1 hypothetical protein CPB85DRAFT_932948 [Mucidula mucida]